MLKPNKGNITYGDNSYYEFSFPRYSLLNARIQLVSAISKHVPQVFETLHQEPLEAYRESGLLACHRTKRLSFWASCAPDADIYFKEEAPSHFDLLNKAHEGIRLNVWQLFSAWGLETGNKTHIQYFSKEIQPRLESWFAHLERWAQSWNLQVGWVYHWALLKLDSYAQPNNPTGPIYAELNPPLRRDLFGSDVQPPIITDYYVDRVSLHDYWVYQFKFKGDPWRPLIETPDEYAQRTREEFEGKLARYLSNTANFLDLRPDLTRVRLKPDERHYEWLARFQCGGEKASAIGKEKGGLSRSRVHHIISELAEVIGLPLRQDKPGRPRRAK